jgi:putative membrane protein
VIATLRILHLFGAILWLGGLLAATTLLRIAIELPQADKGRSYMLARRLLSSLANSGALVAIILGAALLAAEPELLRQGWLHVKLFLVLIMLIVHGRLYLRARVLETEPSHPATAGQFAAMHGVFSLILLAILFLVLVRPF